jgi:prepilin-type N-terminal cleavage/methylation domain-containing protein
MRFHKPAIRGFTMVELMITVAVILVLLIAATPSFIAFRQRAALRGAGEQVFSLWNQARFEAAKRNQMVKFVVTSTGSDFCIGLAETTDKDDDTACDCLTNACGIANFPGQNNQGSWNGVTLSGTPTLGADTGVVVIDPKLTQLTDADDAGTLSMNGPPGRNAYKLNLAVDQLGRGYLCESTSATSHMSDYAERKCDP